MHRGRTIRDLPYPSRTVSEVSGVCWKVFWHQQRACWAAARSRSWQSAASMDVGIWDGGKGVSLSPSVDCAFPGTHLGLQAHGSKLLLLLPSSRDTLWKAFTNSEAFLCSQETLQWSGAASAFPGCTLIILLWLDEKMYKMEQDVVVVLHEGIFNVL